MWNVFIFLRCALPIKFRYCFYVIISLLLLLYSTRPHVLHVGSCHVVGHEITSKTNTPVFFTVVFLSLDRARVRRFTYQRNVIYLNMRHYLSAFSIYRRLLSSHYQWFVLVGNCRWNRCEIAQCFDIEKKKKNQKSFQNRFLTYFSVDGRILSLIQNNYSANYFLSK